ncbi:hypothetical protein C1645_813918 [Glomus cerebriforme]|uniref:ATP-grasp domain-containing protein n=1 Tax=Glomus cerebriforme TaxID=658196 RepID=A0A397TM20_9GLOM|nr:hypothetical protein C1645_813918 [Glomus cerebriforme]
MNNNYEALRGTGNTTHNGAYELNSLTLDTLYKNNIRLPAVVKPICGRGSQGVKKVNTMERLKEHAKNLLTSGAVINIFVPLTKKSAKLIAENRIKVHPYRAYF